MKVSRSAAVILAIAAYFAAASAAPGQEASRLIEQYLGGDYRQTLQLLDQAKAASASTGDRQSHATALLRRARFLQAHGFPQSAMDDLLACRRVIEAVPPAEAGAAQPSKCAIGGNNADPLVAELAGALAESCLSIGERQEAASLFQRSNALAETSDRPRLAFATHMHLGRMRLAERAWPEAEREFRGAIDDAEDLGRPDLVVQARLALADTLTERHRAADLAGDLGIGAIDVREIRQAFADARRSISATEPLAEHHAFIATYAYLYLDALDATAQPLSDEMGERLQQELEAAQAAGSRRGNDRLQAAASGALGRLHGMQGRPDEAKNLFLRAIMAARRDDDPVALSLWFSELGSLLIAHDQDSGIDAYRQAVEQLERVRRFLNGAPTHGPDAASRVYRAYAEALLARASDGEREKEDVQRDRLAALHAIEGLRAEELESFFLDDCVASVEAERKPVYEDLDDRTGAIYPIIFEDRVELLLLRREDGSYRIDHPVPVQLPHQDLTRRIDALRCFLDRHAPLSMKCPEEPPGPKDLKDQSAELFEVIIRPLERDHLLDGLDTIVYLPAGALRAIPLAALYDDVRKEYLVRRFATAVSPGLFLLEPSQRFGPARVLAAGTSQYFGNDFPALNGVNHELGKIIEIYGGRARRLEDQDFTQENLRQTLRSTPYTVVHLATHASFPGGSDEPFFLVQAPSEPDASPTQRVAARREAGLVPDQKVTLSELEDLVKSTEFRDATIELLVLSACQTAAGDDAAALGLAGAGVKAGARSVLASLWNVHDEFASGLMPKFYRMIQEARQANPSISKARVLQKMKLDFMNENNGARPSTWSAFVLIGAWK